MKFGLMTAVGLFAGFALTQTAHAGEVSGLVINLPPVPQPHLKRAIMFDRCSGCVVSADERINELKRWDLNEELTAARRGDTRDQVFLAMDYLTGANTVRDPRRAIDWLTRAAKSGSVEAMSKLGELYMGTKDKTLADPQKAILWFDRAADAGSADACVTLGDLYSDGQLVPRNDSRAEAWYLRAARTGYVPAQIKLAQWYMARENVADAFTWYRHAAEEGDRAAMSVLCAPPDTFTAESRTIAHHLCEAHPRAAGIAPVTDEPAYPAQAYFDLSTLATADQTALTKALLAAVSGKVEDAYPPRALDDGVEGWAEIDCEWTAGRTLAYCVTASEYRRGYRFGYEAARLLGGTALEPMPDARPGRWSRFRVVWHLQPET